MLMSLSALATANKTYTLAVEINPPFTFVNEQKQIRGLSVEMLELLAVSQGAELETIECPFARCMKLAEQGQADFIFGIIKSAERETFFHFIEPPFYSSTTHYSFYQLKNPANPIRSLNDLQNQRIGVQRGARHFSKFDNDPDISKVEIAGIPTLIEMLRKKRIEAFLMLTLSAEPYLKKFDPRGHIKASPFSYEDRKAGFIALSKKSKHVRDLTTLNTAMASLKQKGDIEKVLRKYSL